MTDTSYDAWRGHDLIDQDGTKVGKIDEVYANDQTGEPEWVTVNTGLFGTRSSFVPLQGAHAAGQDLQVPYSKDQIKSAHNIDADGHIGPDEVAHLYEHYSLTWDESAGRGENYDRTYDRDVDRDRDLDRDRTRGTDDAMTRSEEEMRVGKESVESGRARLRKYVVTEDVQTTVPVQREEVRVEREPITDRNVGDALEGRDIGESEHEVVLHEERPVVSKEAVPKERVRLDKETVTDERQVSGKVRKERVETEGLDEPEQRRPR